MSLALLRLRALWSVELARLTYWRHSHEWARQRGVGRNETQEKPLLSQVGVLDTPGTATPR